jgi:hypothetical protein
MPGPISGPITRISKLQREQRFNGVLELKSGVRLLREVYTRNKQCREQTMS